jgi:hypothetical protein
VAVNKEISDKEAKYNWDRTQDRETLIIRRMLYDNPREVVKDYGIDYLKKLFTERLHLFDKLNINFWKIVLSVSDEEIEEIKRKNFRFRCQIWDKGGV